MFFVRDNLLGRGLGGDVVGGCLTDIVVSGAIGTWRVRGAVALIFIASRVPAVKVSYGRGFLGCNDGIILLPVGVVGVVVVDDFIPSVPCRFSGPLTAFGAAAAAAAAAIALVLIRRKLLDLVDLGDWSRCRRLPRHQLPQSFFCRPRRAENPQTPLVGSRRRRRRARSGRHGRNGRNDRSTS